MANYARQRIKQSRYMDQADQAVDNIYKNVKMAHAFFREDKAATAQKSKKRRFFSGLFKVVTLGVFHILAVTLSAIAYAVAVGNESQSKSRNTKQKNSTRYMTEDGRIISVQNRACYTQSMSELHI